MSVIGEFVSIAVTWICSMFFFSRWLIHQLGNPRGGCSFFMARISKSKVIYVGTVIFFAWVFVTIFDDMEEVVNGKPVNKGLDSFSRS